MANTAAIIDGIAYTWPIWFSTLTYTAYELYRWIKDVVVSR